MTFSFFPLNDQKYKKNQIRFGEGGVSQGEIIKVSKMASKVKSPPRPPPTPLTYGKFHMFFADNF